MVFRTLTNEGPRTLENHCKWFVNRNSWVTVVKCTGNVVFLKQHVLGPNCLLTFNPGSPKVSILKSSSRLNDKLSSSSQKSTNKQTQLCMWLVQSDYSNLQHSPDLIWNSHIVGELWAVFWVHRAGRFGKAVGTAGFSPETRWIWEPTANPWGCSSSPVIGW